MHTSVVDEVDSHDNDTSDVEVDESLRRMSNKELLKYVASIEGRLAAVEKLVKPGKIPIDVKESVAVEKSSGDLPKVCITKIVVIIYELFINYLLI